jgi:hypothetical protein
LIVRRCGGAVWSIVPHGELSTQLRERHDADDFETKTQDKLAVAE